MKGRPVINIAGQRFGNLLVRSRAGGKDTQWMCECDCGNRVPVASGNLRSGRQPTCGCGRRTAKRASMADAPRHTEYKAYTSARERCNNPNNPAHEWYFDLGVKFKFRSFEEFYNELGARPSSQHSVDRYPNGNGNYEKGNVRWATPTEQIANRTDRGKLGNNQYYKK